MPGVCIFDTAGKVMTTSDEKLAFKRSLKEFCERTIQQRIDIARQAMDNAQSAANGEEKSSAGDKYETSRAMSHLEKDMQARQLAAHMHEYAQVHALTVHVLYDRAASGSVIQCDNITFFIGAGLGKQVFNGTPVIFLSPMSPLAQKLINKKAGDGIEFNGTMMIREIF